MSHGGCVLQQCLGLASDGRRGGIVRQRQRPLDLLAGDLGRYQRHQLRLERIQFIQTCCQACQLVGELVDAVDRVEQGSDRPADGNVEAVRFPVEVVTKRPEKVVKVSDLISQFIDRGHRFVKVLGLVVSSGGDLLLEGILLLQNRDRFRDFAGLCPQVGRAVFLVWQVSDLAAALRTDLKRYRAMLNRNTQGPGDVLDHGDAHGALDVFGYPVQDEHVGGIAHVVVGLDHQHVGIQSGLGEMPVRSRISDIDPGVVG